MRELNDNRNMLFISIFLFLLTVDLFPTPVLQDNDSIITEKERQSDKAPNKQFSAEDILALQEKHRHK